MDEGKKLTKAEHDVLSAAAEKHGIWISISDEKNAAAEELVKAGLLKCTGATMGDFAGTSPPSRCFEATPAGRLALQGASDD